jgi:HEPN domain-containing protein
MSKPSKEMQRRHNRILELTEQMIAQEIINERIDPENEDELRDAAHKAVKVATFVVDAVEEVLPHVVFVKGL